MIQCSQDQWDIYKLDPLYTCLVRSHPHITQITRVTNVQTAPQNPHRKRRASTPSPGPSWKKLRNDQDEDASAENKSVIDEMIVDPLPHSNTMDGFHGTSMPKGHRSERQSSEGGAGQAHNAEASEDLPADTTKRKRMLIRKAWMISDVMF
jgi:hypothetical protein